MCVCVRVCVCACVCMCAYVCVCGSLSLFPSLSLCVCVWECDICTMTVHDKGISCVHGYRFYILNTYNFPLNGKGLYIYIYIYIYIRVFVHFDSL